MVSVPGPGPAPVLAPQLKLEPISSVPAQVTTPGPGWAMPRWLGLHLADTMCPGHAEHPQSQHQVSGHRVTIGVHSQAKKRPRPSSSTVCPLQQPSSADTYLTSSFLCGGGVGRGRLGPEGLKSMHGQECVLGLFALSPDILCFYGFSGLLRMRATQNQARPDTGQTILANEMHNSGSQETRRTPGGGAGGSSTGVLCRMHLCRTREERAGLQPKGWEAGHRTACPLTTAMACHSLSREDRGQPGLPGWQLSNGHKAH